MSIRKHWQFARIACWLFTNPYLVIITACVRSTREGNVYTWECLSVHKEGSYSGWGGGTSLGLVEGYLTFSWQGGVPAFQLTGVPTLARVGTPCPRYISPVQDRYLSVQGKYLPCPRHKYLLCGGRYASCVHAGELSCSFNIFFPPKT